MSLYKCGRQKARPVCGETMVRTTSFRNFGLCFSVVMSYTLQTFGRQMKGNLRPGGQSEKASKPTIRNILTVFRLVGFLHLVRVNLRQPQRDFA